SWMTLAAPLLKFATPSEFTRDHFRNFKSTALALSGLAFPCILCPDNRLAKSGTAPARADCAARSPVLIVPAECDRMSVSEEPLSFWQRLEHGHVKPWLRRFKSYRSVELGGIRVAYKSHLDGGGREFGQDFIPFLRRRGMQRQHRVFEWCA